MRTANVEDMYLRIFTPVNTVQFVKKADKRLRGIRVTEYIVFFMNQTAVGGERRLFSSGQVEVKGIEKQFGNDT